MNEWNHRSDQAIPLLSFFLLSFGFGFGGGLPPSIFSCFLFVYFLDYDKYLSLPFKADLKSCANRWFWLAKTVHIGIEVENFSGNWEKIPFWWG